MPAGVLLLTTIVCPILCNLELLGSKHSKSYAALSLILWYAFMPIGAAVGAFVNGRVAVKQVYVSIGHKCVDIEN